MNYLGKLYGHLGGKKYFDTGKTDKDWDALESKILELEKANKEALILIDKLGVALSQISTGTHPYNEFEYQCFVYTAKQIAAQAYELIPECEHKI